MEDQRGIHKIISGCAKKDKRAQKALYEKYSAYLFGICLTYSNSYADAEDTLHDGFLKIFSGIQSYKGVGSFEGWMRKIMVNTALEKYRRSNKLIAIAENIKNFSEVSINNILDDLSASEIMEVVQSLSSQYRIVFMLYAVEGYTHKEISNMLGISEGTSKSNLSRARDILQKKISTIYEQRIQLSPVIDISTQKVERIESDN